MSNYQDPQASPPCIFDPATGLTYWKDGSVTDIDGNVVDREESPGE